MTSRPACRRNRIAPIWLVARALALVLLALFCAHTAYAQQNLTIAYISRADDPYYEPHRGYTGLQLIDRHPALDGAKLAIRDSQITGRALGMNRWLRFHLTLNI